MVLMSSESPRLLSTGGGLRHQFESRAETDYRLLSSGAALSG